MYQGRGTPGAGSICQAGSTDVVYGQLDDRKWPEGPWTGITGTQSSVRKLIYSLQTCFPSLSSNKRMMISFLCFSYLISSCVWYFSFLSAWRMHKTNFTWISFSSLNTLTLRCTSLFLCFILLVCDSLSHRNFPYKSNAAFSGLDPPYLEQKNYKTNCSSWEGSSLSTTFSHAVKLSRSAVPKLSQAGEHLVT